MFRALLVCTALTFTVACSEAGDEPDATVGGNPDAPIVVADAMAGGPDAPVDTPDAPVATPDALVATPDAALPDGMVPVADAAVPDAMVPDAMITPDAMGGCTTLPTTGTLTINGETLGTDPVWLRPLAASACPASGFSAVGTAVPYNTFVLCNTSGGPLTLDFAMDGAQEGAYTHTDPYLVLYDGQTIPADALQCLDGDDDGGSGNGSLATAVTIADGAFVTVVASGFDNTDIGTYAIRIVAP